MEKLLTVLEQFVAFIIDRNDSTNLLMSRPTAQTAKAMTMVIRMGQAIRQGPHPMRLPRQVER